jgi:predicted RNase H-like HicB family nuclease/predicted RNA binding protein YcfA (HicA-like mRNA interferase family)
MKVRDLLKTLATDGWVLKNQEGSHRQFVHPTKPGKATVNGHAEIYNETGRMVKKMKDTRYAVVFERSATGYGAYVPDLPGCIATGRTLDLTRQRMRQAITAHLQAMREDGDSIPEPSHVEMLEVA